MLSTTPCMPDDKLHFLFSVKDDFQIFFQKGHFSLLTTSNTDIACLPTGEPLEALILLPCHKLTIYYYFSDAYKILHKFINNLI